MKIAFKKLIAVQAIYTRLTAIWVIADIVSFSTITVRIEDNIAASFLFVKFKTSKQTEFK